MEPLAVIEAFDERKDVLPGVVSRLIRLMVNQLILQGTEEAFRHGIVVAIAFATHARGQAERGEALPIGTAAVLGALIRVVDEARAHGALAHRHRKACSTTC